MVDPTAGDSAATSRRRPARPSPPSDRRPRQSGTSDMGTDGSIRVIDHGLGSTRSSSRLRRQPREVLEQRHGFALRGGNVDSGGSEPTSGNALTIATHQRGRRSMFRHARPGGQELARVRRPLRSAKRSSTVTMSIATHARLRSSPLAFSNTPASSSWPIELRAVCLET